MTTVPLAAPAPVANPRRLRVIAALLAVYAIWSTTYLGLRVVVASAPALLSSSARFVVAGSLLFALSRARGIAAPTARQWLAAAPAGLLLFPVGNGFVSLAEQSISSGVAAVACATMPLWASLFGALMGDRPTAREGGAMVLGFAGVCVLLGAEVSAARGFHALLLALAPIGWALGSMLTRKLPQATGSMGVAAQMLIGGAALFVGSQLRGEAIPTSLPLSAWAAWGYLVLAGSVVGFSAYAYLLRETRASLAMSYAYVNPLLAVLAGALFAGEALSPLVGLATALIALAVALVVRR